MPYPKWFPLRIITGCLHRLSGLLVYLLIMRLRYKFRADIILQFGMLEGSAVVTGKKVIYDPQNPERPERFDAKGSTADELAYVLNRGEAYKLTGHAETHQVAEVLLNQLKCKSRSSQIWCEWCKCLHGNNTPIT